MVQAGASGWCERARYGCGWGEGRGEGLGPVCAGHAHAAQLRNVQRASAWTAPSRLLSVLRSACDLMRLGWTLADIMIANSNQRPTTRHRRLTACAECQAPRPSAPSMHNRLWRCCLQPHPVLDESTVQQDSVSDFNSPRLTLHGRRGSTITPMPTTQRLMVNTDSRLPVKSEKCISHIIESIHVHLPLGN